MGGAQRCWWVAVVSALLGAQGALAQFTAPSPSPVRERLNGVLNSASGAPAPEAGDQLAVFAAERLIGLHTFTSGQSNNRSFSMLVFGDNPDTQAVEGPASGARMAFRFYDSSTNETRTDVGARNPQGESLNLTFQGELVIELPGVPLDLTPTREVNALLGVTGGGGGGGSGINYDVDGDGAVTKRDAALVLRIVLGARRGVAADVIGRADVNGDGAVTTDDAIEVLRNR